MSKSIIDVAVIGAGPGGLILTKQLAAAGANFITLERNKDVGGIWDIDAPGSPMYESAHFISSRTLSGFPGFPMPNDFPDYPNHRQLLSYIRSYADKYELRNHIEFNRSVIAAERDTSGLWCLQFADGSALHARYLICANGVTWEPNKVQWPGSFDGEIRHSVTYRSAEELKGKRVMVVGCGNSGVDIACDAAFASDQAYLSTRRGYHFVPKHIMGKPADVFAKTGPKLPFRMQQIIFGSLLKLINGKATDYGLPEPDHKLFESHPLMNTQILHYLGHGDCIGKPGIEHFDGKDVVFTDGSREQIDLILTATGYKHSCPFLAADTLEDKDGRPDLYLRIFSKKYNNLAVLGFVEFASAAYANFDSMAELIVTDALAGASSTKKAKLDNMKQNHNPDLKGNHRYIKSERHTNYVDVDTYLKIIAATKCKIAA